MNCLDPVLLQSLVDGALLPEKRREADVHLRACGGCRDAVRSLRRVDAYLHRDRVAVPGVDLVDSVVAAALSGEFSASVPVATSRSRETFGRTPGPRACGRMSVAGERPGLIRWLTPIGVAATLVCAVLLSVRATPDGAMPPQAAVPAGVGLLQDLRWALPELDPWESPHALLARLPEGSSLHGDGFVAGGSRLPLVRALRDAWMRDPGPDDRVRLLRAASLISASDFRLRAESFAMKSPERLLEHALASLAAFGGDAAASALQRVASRRTVPDAALAEALVRTGSSRVANRVWSLLLEAGTDLERSYVELHRVPGSRASRILAADFMAGSTAPVLRRLIAERPGALEELRHELPRLQQGDRVRVLGLLGESGDDAAVPLLERQLHSGGALVASVRALERVAHSGSSEAVLALARALPASEDAVALHRSTGGLVLEQALRGLPAKAAEACLAGGRDGRLSERRRYVLAAGLIGGDRVLEHLTGLLGVPQVRRAALTGLALLGRRASIADISRFARSEDRRTRRCAFAALAAIGGDEAARVLSKTLRRSVDRRSVIGIVCDAKDPWVIPIYVDGLMYRDTRDDCLRGLRRLVGGRGPTRDDPAAWKVWLGLETEKT